MELFGKYALLKRLAFGGMAEIFLARLEGQEGFRKTCVLKRILPQFSADEDFVRMFVDEAVLAARLTHPNVVQTYDFGSVAGSYFIAMEFIDGTDLRKLVQTGIKRARSFTLAECAALGEQIARGLSYVHNLRDENGEHLSIVHRDISPHNIMVSRAGQAKIMDFGIAKAAMRAVKTRTGMIKGKLAYMAPEQAAAREIDKRCDQFAVGLVLWECITGQRHFDGNSEPELLGQVMASEIRDVRELRPEAPEALARIIGRMLSKEPSDRFPDLADAEQALSAFRFSLGAEGAVRLDTLVTELAPPLDLRPDGSASGAGHSSPGRPATKSIPAEGGENPGTTGWATVASGPREGPTSTLYADSEPSFEPATIGVTASGSVRVTETATSVQEPTPKWPVAVAVFLALMLVGGGAAIFVLSSSDEASESPATASAPGKSSVAVSSPAPVVEGVVRIESKPAGARILLSGAEIGLSTPAELPRQPVGTQLEITLQLQGHVPWRGRVEVDEELERVSASLIPVSKKEPAPAAETATAATSPARVPEARVPPKRPPRRPPSSASPSRPVEAPSPKKRTGTGTLFLRSLGPWAYVYLDGKNLGSTPLTGVKVPAGTLKLRLENPEAGIKKTITVTVPKDETFKKTVRLP